MMTNEEKRQVRKAFIIGGILLVASLVISGIIGLLFF